MDGSRGTLTPSSSTALTTYVAASIAKASSTEPRVARRTPASGRPTRSAAPSAMLLAELAVTRSRSLTICGMTAVFAGRKRSVTVAIRKAITYTSSTSTVSTNGTEITSPARTTSQPIMVQRRSHRSTRAPASGPSRMFGTAAAAKVNPTSTAEPVAW